MAGLQPPDAPYTSPAPLSRIFTGGVPANTIHGSTAKQRCIASRAMGAGGPLTDAGRTAMAGPAPVTERTGGKRMFENAPMTQSIVDQVVFNRDMDFSGEEQFDEEFMVMFTGSAGQMSGSTDRQPRGKRTYQNAPNTQSVVDQVVFGRDMDFSGETQYDKEFIDALYKDAAGRLSAAGSRTCAV
mmetsp:Transcript_117854/g.334158  ORF Transcript_117854/g.334158 Transcript_117854/m.334158 type:complete len:185 (-) Transcript_117854:188-742(-)